MNKRLILSILISPLLCTSIVFCKTVFANDNVIAIKRPLQSNLPLPKIDATAWSLMEVNSGWVVAGKNSDQPLPPASITKLMSNYVLFSKLKAGDIKLEDQVSISEDAWKAEGSRMFANVNSQISLESLLRSTIVQSGNDAAIALAEHVAGSEPAFASLMNQSAAKLSLQNSFFVNSTGLPADGHSMSANDIATLSAAIIKEFPDYYPWYAEKSYRHNEITQFNRNKLLWKDSTIDGLKTGHTKAAGFCLVGTAKRNGQRWIAVVLGSQSEKSREQAVMSLLNYAFSAFEPMQILNQQGGVTSVEVFKGNVDSLRLQTRGAVNIVVPRGRKEDIAMEFNLNRYFVAPIEVGNAMGVASVSLDNQVIADVPLVAMSSIKEGGFWKKFKDGIRLQYREWGAANND